MGLVAPGRETAVRAGLQSAESGILRKRGAQSSVRGRADTPAVEGGDRAGRVEEERWSVTREPRFPRFPSGNTSLSRLGEAECFRSSPLLPNYVAARVV